MIGARSPAPPQQQLAAVPIRRSGPHGGK